MNHSSIASITMFNENGSDVGIRDQAFRDPSFLHSDWHIAFRDRGVRWVPAHVDPYQPTICRRKA